MTVYVSLSTPGVLIPRAAASFERARKALSNIGIKTGTTHAVQATRTYDQQVVLFLARYQKKYTEYAPGKVDMRVWNGTRYYRKPGTYAAAVPGTSNHGNGDTVDWQGLGSYSSSSWKRAAAILKDHGWNNNEGRQVGESWHWTYVLSDDNRIPKPDPKPTNTAKVGNMKDLDVERFWYDRSTDYALKSGDWTRLRIKDDALGDVTFAFGPQKSVIANICVHVSGLPEGEQIQIRPYIDVVKDGKTSRFKTLARGYGETTGTDGNTILRTSIVTGLSANQRLRAEVWVPSSVTGAKVAYTGIDGEVKN